MTHDRAFVLRLAPYCAGSPVALERLAYDATTEQVKATRSSWLGCRLTPSFSRGAPAHSIFRTMARAPSAAN